MLFSEAVEFGAVNCEHAKQFCQRQSIRAYPTFRLIWPSVDLRLVRDETEWDLTQDRPITHPVAYCRIVLHTIDQETQQSRF